MKRSTRALCAASRSRSSAPPLDDSASRTMLSRSDIANRKLVWNTSATAACRSSGASADAGTPPTRTSPDDGAARPTVRWLIVDLPEPVAPTSATRSPGAIAKLTSWSTVCSGSYPKVTPRSSRPSGPSGNVAGGVRSAPGASGCTSTSSTRSTDTTARGSSSRKKPNTRMGKPRIENRVAACTSSPALDSPEPMRQAPTRNSAIVPRFGSTSSSGSNDARSRATCRRSSRSAADAAAKRSLSRASIPRVFTASAPSKLSCATADTSPRRRCTRADGPSTRVVYTRFTTVSVGNRVRAMRV